MKKNIAYIKLLPLLAVMILVQCALLNTFYNGRTAYRTTLKEHKKIMGNNPDSLITLPKDLEKGYDRAIEKSNKVLKVYPQKVKWHDNSIFLKARAQIMKGEYTYAVTNLKDLQNRFPESPFIPESWVLLGKAYLYKENYNKAEEALRYALENYPKLDKKGEITLLLVEVSVNREGRSKAIEKLETALKEMKSDKQRLEIIIQLSELYLELKLYPKAIETLKKAPRLRDNPYKLYRVDLNLVRAYRQNGDLSDALEIVSKMLKNSRYNRYRPVILLERGFIFRDQEDFKKAVKAFEDIVPLEGFDNIRGIAAYELGKISQHKEGDFVTARIWYDKALGLLKDKKLLDEVTQIVKGLKDRDAYLIALNDAEQADTLSQDTTDTAEVFGDTSYYSIKYKLGETYWLNLKEPDSAFNTFEDLCKDDGADSVTVMKSFYGLAWISLNMLKDTAVADSLFNMIIDKYPATVVAKKAQEALGMEVTIATRQDSALLAYAEAEILWMEKNNKVKAVNSFYKIYKNYPEMEDISSSALYTAGWICDNILHKNKNALKFYRKLCEQYPESGLCKDYALPKIKVVDDTLAVLKALEGGFEIISDDNSKKIKDSVEEESSLKDTANIEGPKQKKGKLKRHGGAMSGPSAAFGPAMRPMGPPSPAEGETSDKNRDSERIEIGNRAVMDVVEDSLKNSTFEKAGEQEKEGPKDSVTQ